MEDKLNNRNTNQIDTNNNLLIDAAMGKLARWLRMIGYSCYYNPDLSSDSIVRLAKEKNLVLLTKSQNTINKVKSNDVSCLLVKGNSIREQLISIRSQNVKLKIPEISDARCSICNGEINIIQDLSTNSIPKKSRDHYNEFFKCIDCNQIYWEGSHWKRIRETIRSVLI